MVEMTLQVRNEIYKCGSKLAGFIAATEILLR
jgi:hypothetical protein